MSGQVQITDAIRTIQYLWFGSWQPTCLDAGDANDDGAVDLSDPLRTVTFLFIGGVETIPAPFPGEGTDSTEDELGRCL